MRRTALLLVSSALWLAACATPVGVDRADPRQVTRELTADATNSRQASAGSIALLTRLDLYEEYERDPEAALATLHAGLAPTGDLERLFALAELSFLYADRKGRHDYALAAAIYAYAFFVGERTPWSSFDPRIQTARNVYNRGLTAGLMEPEGEHVEIERGRYALPFGTLDVELEPEGTTWAGWQLVDFVPATAFRVRGLRNRYRKPGFGAPLTASLGGPSGAVQPPGAEYIPPRLKVPVTAFLRLSDVRSALETGQLEGRLELYNEDERSHLVVGGTELPLEIETTSALAYQLEGAPIWDYGLAGFRLGDFIPFGQTERLWFLSPYRPGRIPVVLVHGTFSTPATWAELVNEMRNDPEISKRFQFWLFFYNTGNPIAYSGGLLVERLKQVVAELDPQGTDPLMRQMVVVGHSQGGLLTKLTAVDSGDRFWEPVSKVPISQLDLDPETRALLERSLFYKPLPFVRRIVFMSTPHGGSYLSDYRITSWLTRFVKMPLTISKLAVDLAANGRDELYLRKLDRMPTSLDNMKSNNPFLRTLHGLPIAPGIIANSIIAVQGGPPPEGGSDGVVRYEAAHIDGVESELVVDSDHSVQMTQRGIQELRRILLRQAADASASAATGGLPAPLAATH